MNITLSSGCLALAQRQAAQAGYLDLTAYLEHLIDEVNLQQEVHQRTLAAIREGLEDAKTGRTRPMSEALADIARKHDLSVKAVTSEDL